MVKVPRFYGIVMKRSEKSRPFEERWDAFLATLQEDMRSDRLNFDRDDRLVSFSAGMSMEDALHDVKRLKAGGLIEGQDFCLTARLGKSVGELPKWLVPDVAAGTVSLAPQTLVQRVLRTMRQGARRLSTRRQTSMSK